MLFFAYIYYLLLYLHAHNLIYSICGIFYSTLELEFYEGININKHMKLKYFLLFFLACFLTHVQAASSWIVNPGSYRYDMTVYASLILDGKAVSDYSDYEIAAFVGDECRGVAEALSSKGYTWLTIRVYSNETAGETVKFVMRNRTTLSVVEMPAIVEFENQGRVGMPSSPFGLYYTDSPADVNADGRVSIADAVNVIGVIKENGSASVASGSIYDMNHDGSADAADVKYIADVILEKEIEIEIETVTYTDGAFPFYDLGCAPPVVDGSIHFEPSGEWAQFFCRDVRMLVPGNYIIELRVSSSLSGDVDFCVRQGWDEGNPKIDNIFHLPGGSVFETCRIPVTIVKGGMYDFILAPGTLQSVIDVNYIKLIKLEKSSYGEGPKSGYTNYLPEPSSLNVGDKVENFIVCDANHDFESATIVSEDGVKCVKIVGKTNPENNWDTQFFVYTPNKKWKVGEQYRFSMKYKASKAVDAYTQVQSTPGNYMHYQMLYPNPSFTTEWQETTWEGVIVEPAEEQKDLADTQQTISFSLNLNKDTDPATSYIYYIGDIMWESLE